MKRVCIVFTLIINLIFMQMSAYAVVQDEVSTNVTVTIENIFKVEYFPPDGTHVMFSDTVPFMSVNPKSTFALPDGRSPNDGKSDVGIYCVSTEGVPWYIKIGVTGGNLPPDKLKYYLNQPYMWDGSNSVQTDGSIVPSPPAWTPIPVGTSSVVYQSGAMDMNNMPYGTLLTIGFQLDPSGLVAGPYTATVTYTMTTTP